MTNKSLNPISIQSKKMIIKALLDLLSVKSFNEITITEIAEKAQLARRTFYRNFDSKEDVLNLYVKNLCIEYIKLLKEEETLNISNVAKVYFTFWGKHLKFLTLMEKNDLLYVLLQKYNHYLPMIHRKFKKVERHDNDVLEYILHFSAGGFWNVLIKWIKNGAKQSPSEMASIVSIIVDDSKLL
jgi:Transcriptional regulator